MSISQLIQPSVVVWNHTCTVITDCPSIVSTDQTGEFHSIFKLYFKQNISCGNFTLEEQIA